MKLHCVTAAALLVATVAGQRGLLYTPKHEVTSQQGVATTALNEVRSNEVEFVAPNAQVGYQSQAFATLPSYITMIGDRDNNGEYWDPYLFGTPPSQPGQPFAGIDALLRARTQQGYLQPNARNLFISASDTVTHCLGAGAGWPVTSGDVFRILPSGQVERFLSEAQVRAAFGLQGPVNVDAAALYYHPEPNVGGIYLSFEDDEMTPGGGIIRDGDILRIPQQAIAWANSPYDGALIVAGVMANTGQIVLPEPQVDARVVNANVSDDAGFAVTQIIDTDGLTLEPQGGFFLGNNPHLWFSGEGLNGCSVLSTAGGGMIVTVGGVNLGENPAVPTVGDHLKLVPTKVSLDGLAVTSQRTCHLAVDTPTPSCTAGCNAVFEVGGGIPGTPAVFLLGAGLDGCAPDPVLFSFANCGFDEVYPFVPSASAAFGGTVLGADGCATLTLPLPAFAGVHYRTQALSLDPTGMLMLSPGLTIDL